MNNAGVIIGSFVDAQGTHGFSKDGDTWTRLEAPEAVDTQPFGINDLGQIVGLANGQTFVYESGTFTAVVHPEGSVTQATGITNAGELVGRYFDAQGVDHGFIARPVPSTSDLSGLRTTRRWTDTPVPLQPVACRPGSKQWHCRHQETAEEGLRR